MTTAISSRPLCTGCLFKNLQFERDGIHFVCLLTYPFLMPILGKISEHLLQLSGHFCEIHWLSAVISRNYPPTTIFTDFNGFCKFWIWSSENVRNSCRSQTMIEWIQHLVANCASIKPRTDFPRFGLSTYPGPSPQPMHQMNNCGHAWPGEDTQRRAAKKKRQQRTSFNGGMHWMSAQPIMLHAGVKGSSSTWTNLGSLVMFPRRSFFKIVTRIHTTFP